MKKFVIFIFVLLFAINVRGELFGRWYDLIPYKPYQYFYDIIVGMRTTDSNDSNYFWRITNGKIQDGNGNYTLSVKYLDSSERYPVVNVIWETEGVGKLELIGNRTGVMDVTILSPLLLISDHIFTASPFEPVAWANVNVENTIIKSGAEVTFNGYNSVGLFSGFTVENGAVVTICNEIDSIPVPF